MTKRKPDRLLAALIARLPTQVTHWPHADRIAWLQMMATAFDVVYGPCGRVQVVPADARDDQADQTATAPHHGASGAALPNTPRRFYVDRDGFAMGDGRPIAMDDLPTGATLWDERAGVECGDVGAILWRDIGTSRRSLPSTVTLRPVFEHHNDV
jgi:hypothetical protein